MIEQYNIPFEAEVLPTLIGGVSTVGAIALVIGCILLYRNRRAMCFFLGYLLSTAAAMAFLIRGLFGGRLGIVVPDFHASNFHSVNVGLFGVFWAVSVAFLLLTIAAGKKSGGS